MSDACCLPQPPTDNAHYRRVLRVALAVNAVMFLIEVISGLQAGSSALLADATDFLGDAGNYALSLWALRLAPVWRSRSACFKGISMGVYSLGVLGNIGWQLGYGSVPQAEIMGGVAALALCANVGVAALLYVFRDGDANMRSVWLCSRNDAIGNVAVLLAAAAVWFTGSAWPDLLAALLMAGLGLIAARQVVRAARAELQPLHRG